MLSHHRCGWAGDLLSRGRSRSGAGRIAAPRVSDIVPHVPKPHSDARRQVPGDRTRLSGIRTQRRPFSLRFPLHARPSFGGGGGADREGQSHMFRYVHDGFRRPHRNRLMLKYPDRVTGVVVQNTPAFGEPIDGPLWAAELAYWKDGSSAHRDAVRSKLTPDAVRNQYVAGTREPSLIDPDNWTINSALLARPGVDEIMLDLLYDIRNNRQTVADARQFFKAHPGQVMIATGVNDPLFPGAAVKPPADMPEIEFHPIDSGHFALEDHCAEIGSLTRGFLARVMPV